MIFRQLFESTSSTYTYLLGDAQTREAVLIDPVFETVERDLQLIQDLGLKLKYILETHVHADHVTGASRIREKTGAQVALGDQNTKVECADLKLKDGQSLSFGTHSLVAVSTPGHTNGCVCYILDHKMVFTGDTLLIRACGRTDFQEGSPKRLYESIHQKLFTLPPSTLLYPAHDYKGQTCTTIDEEKRLNPRIGNGKTLEEFTQIMNGLNLAYPKQIDVAVPANLKCGVKT